MKNSKLIAAAAVALSAAPGANAIAADAAAVDSVADNSLNVSVEGGIVVSDFSKSSDFFESVDKLGDVDDADYDLGGYGAISIGKNFQDSELDWKLSGSITEFLSNDRNANNYYYDGIEYDLVNASEVDDFDFQAVDLDFGRTFNNEGTDGRVFAGIRVLGSQDAASIESGYYYGLVSAGYETEGNFLGLGPRAGMDLRIGGTVGVVGSVSAAAIYGRHSIGNDISYNIYGLDYLEVNESETDWDWVTDVSASAGISVRPSEDAELVVGYRVEQINGIRQAASGLDRDEDVLEHGPMLKLNVKF